MIYVDRARPRRAGPGGQHLPGGDATARYTPSLPGRGGDASGSSSSSPSRAASPSHVAPETPGSIHEGGELGYSLSHAFGAAFDNPDLIAACVVGDGEAETGPLAASWHSNKFLNPATRRGRAAHPAPERLQDRQPDRAGPHRPPRSWRRCSRGYGYRPYFVEGDDPQAMHQAMAATLERVVAEIRAIQAEGPGAAAKTARRAAALAHDRAAHAQGLDRPEGGGRQADRKAPGAPTRSLSRTWPASPGTCACWRTGCGATAPRSFSTSGGALRARAGGAGAAGAHGAWAPTRTPTAACCCGTCAMPDFRDYAVEVPEARRRSIGRGHPGAGRASCAT